MIIIFTQCEFFSPTLTGSFSLKSEWQQVFNFSGLFYSILADFNSAVV